MLVMPFAQSLARLDKVPESIGMIDASRLLRQKHPQKALAKETVGVTLLFHLQQVANAQPTAPDLAKAVFGVERFGSSRPPRLRSRGEPGRMEFLP